MKLKYKKIILLTTMSTMGIGLLTLSLSHDKAGTEESLNLNAKTAPIISDEMAADDNGEDEGVASTFALETTNTPTPTSVPTPTPLPVHDIEKEGYPRITKLIKDYYAAKNNRDVDSLKALLNDPSKVVSQEKLQKRTEYIDDYRNIDVYVKKGFEKGTYIVYAYHEIKFTSINTPAPGLAKFYVVTDSEDNLKIYSGEMDEQTKAYYDERNSDEDVIALIEMTDKKSDEAIEKDEDLLNFWKNMDEVANNASQEVQAQGDTN